MMKKIFCALALVAGFFSCTEDYTDWANPQSNAASEAAEKFVMMVEPTVSAIDFATETSESIQLFTTNLAEGQTDAYVVTVSAEDVEKTVQMEADTEGKVKAADLISAVKELYGAAPIERTLAITILAEAKVTTAEGDIFVKQEAEPYALKVTLDAPYIDPDGYYYVGAVTTNKVYKLSNGGGDPYEDPIFTGVIPAYDGDWHWFKLAASCAFNKDGSFNWDNEEQYCLGPTIKDDDAVSGQCGYGKNSWHLIQSDAFKAYKVTVNVLEMTFTIKGIIDAPEYYGVGTMTNWNNKEKVSAMFPTSKNTITLTTYFTGAYDLRMWPSENFGDWSLGKALGIAENGGNAASGSLCWNVENDGNLASPEAGYYTLDCDLDNMTYTWTKYDNQEPVTYEKIGLVGANDDWDNDIFLTQVENTTNGKSTHLWYALGVQVDYCTWGVQFRTDTAWTKQWGKGDQEFPFAQSNTKDNIPIEPGTYNIYFNDITGHYFFVAQ